MHRPLGQRSATRPAPQRPCRVAQPRRPAGARREDPRRHAGARALPRRQHGVDHQRSGRHPAVDTIRQELQSTATQRYLSSRHPVRPAATAAIHLESEKLLQRFAGKFVIGHGVWLPSGYTAIRLILDPMNSHQRLFQKRRACLSDFAKRKSTGWKNA